MNGLLVSAGALVLGAVVLYKNWTGSGDEYKMRRFPQNQLDFSTIKYLASGSCRDAFTIQNRDRTRTYVLKTPQPGEGYRHMKALFDLVHDQAAKFNQLLRELQSKDTVRFADEWTFEVAQRVQLPRGNSRQHRQWLEPGDICTVEEQLPGEFVKWNNNHLYVAQSLHPTPQLFSHFTHHNTNGTVIVVDIQGSAKPNRNGGIDFVFTDPAVHSKSQQFGGTDFGTQGHEWFFQVHSCNFANCGRAMTALQRTGVRKLVEQAETRTYWTSMEATRVR